MTARGPQPQPERDEPRLHDPGLRSLSRRDYVAIVRRGIGEALSDNMPDSAAALAYYGFLALPSALLVAVGVFGLVADPSGVDTLMAHLKGVVPPEVITLMRGSLARITRSGGGSLTALVVGFVLALWTVSGAMSALMRALNIAYERRESRGFVRVRLVALLLLGCVVVAVALSVGLLVLGPVLSGYVGSQLGVASAMQWIWWTAQWPILILGLLLVFAGLLYFGPDVEQARFHLISPGSLVAVLLWIAASGLFAFYVGTFASYNRAWGSLAAVIVLLTWLWLSSLAVLFGAEINAELERSRELRQGHEAGDELRIPAADGQEAHRRDRRAPQRRPARREGAAGAFWLGTALGVMVMAARGKRPRS